MRRRDFIGAIAGSAAAWPFVVRAQQREQVRRIGVLMPSDAGDAEGQSRLATFSQALRQSGWTVGRNVQLEIRWAAGNTALIPNYAVELVALAPDVLLGTGSPIVAALKRATPSIPIVFALVADSIGDGLVATLAQPGGNATGLTHFEYSIGGKWVELLKETVPRVARVTVLQNPGNRPSRPDCCVGSAISPAHHHSVSLFRHERQFAVLWA
jgi:putative ABC transport system substrate-binding protein